MLFNQGELSVENGTCSFKPKTSVTKTNVALVKVLVEQDA